MVLAVTAASDQLNLGPFKVDDPMGVKGLSTSGSLMATWNESDRIFPNLEMNTGKYPRAEK